MNVKSTYKFTIGSNAFFNGFEDFNAKDNDVLYIIDYPLFGDKIYVMRGEDKDEFLMYDFGKEKLIEQTKDPLQVGKFLVPEIAKHFNITIDDIKKFESLLNTIDDKHSYEKLIYNYYIENGDFVLTDEQLNKVYEKYKQYR